MHFGLPQAVGRGERAAGAGREEALGYRLPGAYRSFLKAAGGCAPVGAALDAELGLLVDQPFFTVRDEAAVNDLVYVNKCLRDHFTKDYLGVAFVQGGVLAVKVRGEALGSVWFCPYDDARDQDGLVGAGAGGAAAAAVRCGLRRVPAAAGGESAGVGDGGEPDGGRRLRARRSGGGVSAMVTFAQAQERAERWVNGEVPAPQHREVRVREFDLGFVAWAEDRAEGPRVTAAAAGW